MYKRFEILSMFKAFALCIKRHVRFVPCAGQLLMPKDAAVSRANPKWLRFAYTAGLEKPPFSFAKKNLERAAQLK